MSGSGTVRHGSSRTPSLAPRRSWSGRWLAASHFAYPFGHRDDFGISRSTLRPAELTRMHRHARNGPFLDRSLPPPWRLVMDWDGFVSELRCNDGNSAERCGRWHIAKWHQALLNGSLKMEYLDMPLIAIDTFRGLLACPRCCSPLTGSFHRLPGFLNFAAEVSGHWGAIEAGTNRQRNEHCRCRSTGRKPWR